VRLPPRWKIFAAAGVAAVVADQLTKLWARHHLPVGRGGVGELVTVIDGFWDWQLSQNPGSAFSLVEGTGARILLSVVAVVALVAIGWMVHRASDGQRRMVAALGLIAGGALGNLIDRAATGVVTDFVHWHLGRHEWPTFNVADAELLIGVAILLLPSRRGSAGTSG